MNKYLTKISFLQNEKLNAALDRGEPVYLYHGTPNVSEVSKEGLNMDKAWGISRDRPSMELEGFYPTLSMSSVKNYSKVYTKDNNTAPLLVKLDSKNVEDIRRNSLLIRALDKMFDTDEYRYTSDVPAKNVFLPGSREYKRLEKNIPYLSTEMKANNE